MLNSVAKKWVDALRSGKYEQGKRFLRRGDNRFCCLGVLCELAVEEGVIPPAVFRTKTYKGSESRYLYDDKSGSIPAKVMEWAGLADSLGIYGNRSLASENDSGKSFSEIAGLD